MCRGVPLAFPAIHQVATLAPDDDQFGIKMSRPTLASFERSGPFEGTEIRVDQHTVRRTLQN
ncbi:hypothetical protein MESS4_p20028 [Mesorhizobium sp. STM 4661]|nr:hypothetical protein MESS4_p20028 [Mesorhizobium sp. STM 4661]